jgi:hypothetical protein
MRAYFANGVDKMRIPWAVEGLPTLLHLSLFLFFVGLGILLFNVNQEVFSFVVSWIGFFSTVYGLITLLPLIRHDSPYNTPLSIPAWSLYGTILYLAFIVPRAIMTYISAIIFVFIRTSFFVISKVHSFFTSNPSSVQIRGDLNRLRNILVKRHNIWHRRFSGWMLGSVEKKAEETTSEQSSEIDVRILGWTISALGDDDSLEKFFETIPGLFNSKLVKHLEREFPLTILKTFWQKLDGLMGRTLSSNSVTESIKSRRAIICNDIIAMVPCPINFMPNNLRSNFDQAPSIARLQAIARWFTHKDYDVADHARVGVAKSLASMQERDDAWITFASDMCGLAAQDLRDNISHGGDNVLLATLIYVSRRAIHSHEFGLLRALTEFDICHTLPGLQHDFCALWNELVREERKQGYFSTPFLILLEIRSLFVALHPSCFHVGPTRFPFCDIANHFPDSTAHVSVSNSRGVSISNLPGDSPDALPHLSTSGGDTASQQANIIAGPSSPSRLATSSEIGDTSQALAATSPFLPVHTSPRPTDASPPGALAAALQDIPPATTLSRPLEGTALKDTVAPCAEPETSEILSTTSMPPRTLAESTPPVLSESSTPCNADAPTASNPMLPVLSIVGSTIPVSPPQFRVPPLSNAEFLALIDGTTPSRPTGNATLPYLCARGLVNTGGMCFANAVLQLLVHSPPLWNLFRQLGDLKQLRGDSGEGGPATGGGKTVATPLVDATVRFFEEFMNKEKEPPPTRQVAGKPTEGREAKKESNVVDSFEPTYIYDAMKDNRKLKVLLVRLVPRNAPLLLIYGGLMCIGQRTAGCGKVFPPLSRHP